MEHITALFQANQCYVSALSVFSGLLCLCLLFKGDALRGTGDLEGVGNTLTGG